MDPKQIEKRTKALELVLKDILHKLYRMQSTMTESHFYTIPAITTSSKKKKMNNVDQAAEDDFFMMQRALDQACALYYHLPMQT